MSFQKWDKDLYISSELPQRIQVFLNWSIREKAVA